MSKNYYFAPGANYFDHHRDITINNPGANAADLLRAALAENAEDIPSSPASDNRPKEDIPFFVPEKLAELGTYSVEQFKTMFHDAVKSGAPKLATFIKHYRELEVFNTQDLNKKETFEVLKAYFGDELDFGYPNFAAYY